MKMLLINPNQFWAHVRCRSILICVLAVAGFPPHQRTAVDDLTEEFRSKVSVPGALTKPQAGPKQKVYLAEDSTVDEILLWLAVKGFSCEYAAAVFTVVG